VLALRTGPDYPLSRNEKWIVSFSTCLVGRSALKNRSDNRLFALISLGGLVLALLLARTGSGQWLEVTNEPAPELGADNPFLLFATNAPVTSPAEPVTTVPSPVFVYRSQASMEAEVNLREAFNRLRTEFTEQLFVASKHHTLTLDQTRHPGFQRFIEWFQAQHNEFPFTSELAESWATGATNDELKEELTANLRTVMESYLTASAPDPLIQIRLVPVAGTNDFANVDIDSLASFSFAGSNIVSISEGKHRLLKIFGGAKVRLADYTAQFLKENCYPLASVADPVQPADRAASTYLAASTNLIANDPNPAHGWEQDLRPVALELLAIFRSGVAFMQDLWEREPTALAALTAVLLFALGGWLLWRPSKLAHATPGIPRESAYTVVFNAARNETVFLPVKAGPKPQLMGNERATWGALVEVDSTIPAVSAAPLDLEWEARVLATEKRAEQLLVEVRAGLAPHLAREMMNELVRKLVSDREGLLRAHWRASSEVAELEQRFARVHATLIERLREYQARNLELEKELAATTEQNCKLLKSRIEDLQKKIESGGEAIPSTGEEPEYRERRVDT